MTCVHTLYKNTNIKTKARFQNDQSYIFTYPLKKHKHKHKGLLPKCLVLHMYIPSTKTQTQTQKSVSKIPSLTCVHTFYNSTSINTKARCQNYQYDICTYPLQQRKHKHKVLLKKIPVSHVYLPSTTTQTLAQRFNNKTTSITFVITLYNNKNINTKACFQNSRFYMFKQTSTTTHT